MQKLGSRVLHCHCGGALHPAARTGFSCGSERCRAQSEESALQCGTIRLRVPLGGWFYSGQRTRDGTKLESRILISFSVVPARETSMHVERSRVSDM